MSMKVYSIAYKVIAAIYSALLLWLLFIGLGVGNITQAIAVIFAGTLLWFAALKSGHENIKSLALTNIATVVLCLPLITRLFQRASFVAENGGMERADGYGSPLAFLIGLIFELSLLAPLLILLIAGLFLLFRHREKNA